MNSPPTRTTSRVTVRITLDPPPAENGRSEGAGFSERVFDRVPRPIAERLRRDFEAYQEAPSQADQYVAYRYSPSAALGSQSEAMLALDLGELRTLQLRHEARGLREGL